jgi:hypothetical protein
MYFHSYSLEENYKASQDSLFLAINAKGGEFMGQSKRTAPPPIFKLQKPSWQLRGELFQEELLFSPRKSIWNRGRNFKILKMLLEIIFLYHGYLQKNLKILLQKICKKTT